MCVVNRKRACRARLGVGHAGRGSTGLAIYSRYVRHVMCNDETHTQFGEKWGSLSIHLCVPRLNLWQTRCNLTLLEFKCYTHDRDFLLFNLLVREFVLFTLCYEMILFCITSWYEILICLTWRYEILFCITSCYEILFCLTWRYEILYCVTSWNEILFCLTSWYENLFCLTRRYKI